METKMEQHLSQKHHDANATAGMTHFPAELQEKNHSATAQSPNTTLSLMVKDAAALSLSGVESVAFNTASPTASSAFSPLGAVGSVVSDQTNDNDQGCCVPDPPSVAVVYKQMMGVSAGDTTVTGGGVDSLQWWREQVEQPPKDAAFSPHNERTAGESPQLGLGQQIPDQNNEKGCRSGIASSPVDDATLDLEQQEETTEVEEEEGSSADPEAQTDAQRKRQQRFEEEEEYLRNYQGPSWLDVVREVVGTPSRLRFPLKPKTSRKYFFKFLELECPPALRATFEALPFRYRQRVIECLASIKPVHQLTPAPAPPPPAAVLPPAGISHVPCQGSRGPMLSNYPINHGPPLVANAASITAPFPQPYIQTQQLPAQRQCIAPSQAQQHPSQVQLQQQAQRALHNVRSSVSVLAQPAELNQPQSPSQVRFTSPLPSQSHQVLHHQIQQVQLLQPPLIQPQPQHLQHQQQPLAGTVTNGFVRQQQQMPMVLPTPTPLQPQQQNTHTLPAQQQHRQPTMAFHL